MALHKFLERVQREKSNQEHEGTSKELTAVKKKSQQVYTEFPFPEAEECKQAPHLDMKLSSPHSSWACTLM